MPIDQLWEAALKVKPESFHDGVRTWHPTPMTSIEIVGARVTAVIEWHWVDENNKSWPCHKLNQKWATHENAHLCWTVKHTPPSESSELP